MHTHIKYSNFFKQTKVQVEYKKEKRPGYMYKLTLVHVYQKHLSPTCDIHRIMVSLHVVHNHRLENFTESKTVMNILIFIIFSN